ncbi:MAG: hypothetical protein IPF54_28100 [Draconibacterium sp.]|nr:hypothetical protein [Draconibacterium sp.]
MNFIRLLLWTPTLSNTPGCIFKYHEAIQLFQRNPFQKVLDEVFVPMAEYAISKGLYVVMRPPA